MGGGRGPADVMAQLDYMEKRGSGLKRIFNETKKLKGYKDELQPVFKSSASQFMTTIYSVQPVNGGINGGVNGGVNTLSESLNAVFVAINNNPGLKANQLAELLGCSVFTMEKRLKSLRKLNKIEHRGSAKTGGYYPVGS